MTTSFKRIKKNILTRINQLIESTYPDFKRIDLREQGLSINLGMAVLKKDSKGPGYNLLEYPSMRDTGGYDQEWEFEKDPDRRVLLKRPFLKFVSSLTVHSTTEYYEKTRQVMSRVLVGPSTSLQGHLIQLPLFKSILFDELKKGGYKPIKAFMDFTQDGKISGPYISMDIVLEE